MDFDAVSRGPTKAKGSLYGLLQVRFGVPIKFTGKWVTHSKYGKEFQIQKWEPWAETPSEAAVFLSVCIEGFSDLRVSDALTSRYGLDVFQKLAKEPAKIQTDLADVLSSESLERALLGWGRTIAQRDLSVVLKAGGLTVGDIQAVMAKFGSEAAKVVVENPFRLMEIVGISYAKVDRLATRLGVDPGDPRRLQGAILWSIQEAGRQGHLFLKWNEMTLLVNDILHEEKLAPLALGDNPTKAYQDAIRILLEQKSVVLDAISGLYVPEYFNYERVSADLLSKLLTPAILNIDSQAFVASYEKSHQIQLSEAQRRSVDLLVNNKVLVITGLPGTGKCVAGNTLVSGSFGFRPISEFLPNNLPSGETYNVVVSLDSTKGPKNSAYVYNGGCSNTLRIRTSSGYSLEGTPEHPVLVLRQGLLCWSRLDDLIIGDSLVLVRDPKLYTFGSNRRLPRVTNPVRGRDFKQSSLMTVTLARLLGYITSEGSTRSTNSWTITSFDPIIQQFLTKAFKQLGLEPKDHWDKRVEHRVGVRIHSTLAIQWFRGLGVCPEVAATKSIPSIILKSPRKYVRAYLQGLFEGDGSVDLTRSTIEYGTSSETLANQLQVLLLAFGVVCSKCSCIRGAKPYYRLAIYGEDYDQFRRCIGFHLTCLPKRTCASNTNRHLLYGIHRDIRALMLDVRPSKGRNYNTFYRYTLDPSKKNHRLPSRTKLKQLLSFAKRKSPVVTKLTRLLSNTYFYDPLVSITQGKARVVDFGVPNGHEFLSNGFVSHNTTILRALVQLLEEAHLTLALMAPTGIAAKRLASVTGHDASTVHRALKYDGSEWGYHSNNRYLVDGVIVDETSMMDQELLYRLLSALRPDTRLVLVGDDAQLPSVGPGNVLRELVECEEVPHVRLTEIFRQSSKSEIVINSHRINSGKMPELTFSREASEFKFVRVYDESRIAVLIVQMASKLKARNANFQVLSPKYDGTVGVDNLNSLLRDALNPSGPDSQDWDKGLQSFRRGDRLMVTANDYKLNVYNGDVGKLVAIGKEGLIVRIHGVGKGLDMDVPFPNDVAKAKLRLAYAITAHKSQGSEFDTIIMPIVKTQGRMLQRNLLYTAVTRARKRVWLIGDEMAIQLAVNNNKVVRRNTVLAKALIQSLAAGVAVQNNESINVEHLSVEAGVTNGPE